MSRARAMPQPALFYWAAALLVMNLLDGIFTLTAVHAGAASEANPLMRAPLDLGSVWFILMKTGMVSLGLLTLWRVRHRLMAQGAIVGLALFYTAVVGYHLGAIRLWV